MLPEVTQDNVYLFLPYKAAKISTAIRRDSQIGLKEALLSFYQSRAYRLLEHERRRGLMPCGMGPRSTTQFLYSLA